MEIQTVEAMLLSPNNFSDVQIVTYSMNLTNLPVYDHTTYFLKGPQLAFAYGSPDIEQQIPFMVWSQVAGWKDYIIDFRVMMDKVFCILISGQAEATILPLT